MEATCSIAALDRSAGAPAQKAILPLIIAGGECQRCGLRLRAGPLVNRKPWTRALVPPARALLPRPAGRPAGVSFSSAPGETWPRGGAARRLFAVLAAAHMAVHGPRGGVTAHERGKTSARRGIFRLFTCSIARLLSLCDQATFQQLFPCSVGVACVWQPCAGR
jgi:hypothetical protein